MYKCKFCGEIFGPYTKATFYENGEEELWGHIQMNHEEVFEENQNLATPDMIEICYESEMEETDMNNKEFQIRLKDMYESHTATKNRAWHTLNELVYVLRMSGENYQLTITDKSEPGRFVCIPGVIDTFIPVRDLAKKVASVEFDEETYEEFEIKLLLVKVED